MITFREFLDLCEDYNPNAEFVIFNKKTRAVLEQQEDLIRQNQGNSFQNQRGLKFDDVSFMTSRRFYGKTPVSSGGRRIEYSPRYNPSKRGRFRGVWYPDGSYADLTDIAAASLAKGSSSALAGKRPLRCPHPRGPVLSP